MDAEGARPGEGGRRVAALAPIKPSERFSRILCGVVDSSTKSWHSGAILIDEPFGSWHSGAIIFLIVYM